MRFKARFSEESLAFLITIIFYFLLLFNPNNKTFVLFFFLYLFSLAYFLKDFKKSLLLSYLAAWPFNIGKSYVFELVSPSQLNLAYHPYGIGPIMVISIKEIFIVLMFLVLLRNYFLEGKNVFKFDRKSIFLLFYTFSLLVSSLVGSIRPEISAVLSLFSVSLLIFYWYLRSLADEKKSLLRLTISIVCSILLFEALLASLQFLKRSILGVSIEAVNFLPFDFATEAESFYYRSVGTFGHANGLADFLLILLFSLLPSLFFDYRKNNQIVFFSFFSGILTLFLTLGRSAWSSFVVAFLLFLFVAEKRWKLRLKFVKIVPRIFFLSLPVVIPFFVFIFLPRIINTFYSFEIYGAGYTRVEMIKEILKTIKEFPLFGIGLGMDTLYSYRLSLLRQGSVFSYFPEAVHNGYLNHLVQTGIFSLTIYLVISFSFFKDLIDKILTVENVRKKIFGLALACGLASLYLNSLWQPFLPGLQKVIFWSMIYKIGNKDV